MARSTRSLAALFLLGCIIVARGAAPIDLISLFDMPGYQVSFSVDGQLLGGTIYPKDALGNIDPSYWCFFNMLGFLEIETDRLVDGDANWTFVNPDTTSLVETLEYPGASTAAIKELTWNAVGTTPLTNTMFNKTVTVTNGLKLAVRIVNDSNTLLDFTNKGFQITFNFSHPVIKYSIEPGPTDYQSAFVFKTAYYTVKLIEVNFANADGLEVPVNAAIGNTYGDTSGNIFEVDVDLLTSWNQSWYYDPEISIILDGENSAGDGNSDSLLPLISLVALAVVAPVVVVVIVVGVVVIYLRKRHQMTKFRSNTDSLNESERKDLSPD